MPKKWCFPEKLLFDSNYNISGHFWWFSGKPNQHEQYVLNISHAYRCLLCFFPQKMSSVSLHPTWHIPLLKSFGQEKINGRVIMELMKHVCDILLVSSCTFQSETFRWTEELKNKKPPVQWPGRRELGRRFKLYFLHWYDLEGHESNCLTLVKTQRNLQKRTYGRVVISKTEMKSVLTHFQHKVLGYSPQCIRRITRASLDISPRAPRNSLASPGDVWCAEASEVDASCRDIWKIKSVFLRRSVADLLRSDNCGRYGGVMGYLYSWRWGDEVDVDQMNKY